jgi:hypothetical protein
MSCAQYVGRQYFSRNLLWSFFTPAKTADRNAIRIKCALRNVVFAGMHRRAAAEAFCPTRLHNPVLASCRI